MKTLSEYPAPLPPTLYLHFDNCWRENKNKFVLAITHLLVERGIFKKVKFSFLPVGHTHCIVDQMFSRFSIGLRSHDIITIEDLHAVCKASYKSKDGEEVEFEHLEEMAGWSVVLSEYLPKISGISFPRCFRVKRDKEGVVRHHYRQQVQSSKNDPDVRSHYNEDVVSSCGTTSGSALVGVEADNLNWMPHNQPGFQLFSEKNGGLPDLSKIRQVPLKLVDVTSLSDTQNRMKPFITGAAHDWWTQRLQRFQETDDR